jgi:hypothetical protein
MLSLLTGLLGSTTFTALVTIVPLMMRAFDKGETLEWVYKKLPDGLKKRGTEEEFAEVYESLKAALAAIWKFTHK